MRGKEHITPSDSYGYPFCPACEEERDPRCDECRATIPKEYQGEDSLSCCGLDFCSYDCMRKHTE